MFNHREDREHSDLGKETGDIHVFSKKMSAD
jgi:hypothetical protein